MDSSFPTTLVRFTEHDAPALLELSTSIGWPHTVEDWETNLSGGYGAGHRDAGGRAVSSSVIHIYPEAVFPESRANVVARQTRAQDAPVLASVGMVIVRTEARGNGLARAAMADCLEQATECPVMLVATEEGLKLYEGLGFRTVGSLQNLVAPVGNGLNRGALGAAEDGRFRAVGPGDLNAVLALDGEVFGADRGRLLRRRWRQVSHGLMAGRESNRIDGYAWAVPQNERLLIGPVIAPDHEEASRLIAALAGEHPGSVRLDIPAEHGELIGRLVDAGFEKHALRPLMLRGMGSEGRLPGDRGRLFAAAALAFG